jgi:hypothetical protein
VTERTHQRIAAGVEEGAGRRPLRHEGRRPLVVKAEASVGLSRSEAKVELAASTT